MMKISFLNSVFTLFLAVPLVADGVTYTQALEEINKLPKL